MPVWFVLLLLGTAGIVVAKKTSGAEPAHLQPGKYRLCFPSDVPANISLLRAVFSDVVDVGNGCFDVQVPSEITISSIPAGVQIRPVS